MKYYTLFLILVTAFSALGKINEVSVENFNDDFWFLQLYEGSCSNCKADQKDLEDASALFQGLVKFGKANKAQISYLAAYKLKSNPEYFLIKGDFQNYSPYSGKVSRIGISKFILSEIEKTVRSRDAKSFGGKGSANKSKPKEEQSKSAKKDSSGVVVLTDANFEETVLKSDEAWFVEFYSPSCGHCHALQPEWDKLPSKMGAKVKIAKIDATQNRGMAQKYQIKGFPTLLFFSIDDKEQAIPYSSERTAEAMSSWLSTQKIGKQKQQFMKLTKELYDRECNKNIVCLIYIIEKKSQLSELSFIEEILEEQQDKPLRFFYSPRLPKFEDALMIADRSNPKMVGIWDSIQSYKVYNGANQKSEVDAFLAKIMERRTWVKMSEKIVDVIFSKSTSQDL